MRHYDPGLEPVKPIPANPLYMMFNATRGKYQSIRQTICLSFPYDLPIFIDNADYLGQRSLAKLDAWLGDRHIIFVAVIEGPALACETGHDGADCPGCHGCGNVPRPGTDLARIWANTTAFGEPAKDGSGIIEHPLSRPEGNGTIDAAAVRWAEAATLADAVKLARTLGSGKVPHVRLSMHFNPHRIFAAAGGSIGPVHGPTPAPAGAADPIHDSQRKNRSDQ